MYVYKSEVSEDTGAKVYAVGYWRPDGSFAVASRHNKLTDALRRVNYVNGGNGATPPAQNDARG